MDYVHNFSVLQIFCHGFIILF